jgi:hypothetical protein
MMSAKFQNYTYLFLVALHDRTDVIVARVADVPVLE